MSILHRLGLLQKFMILGTIGLMMSALPTYLYVSDSLRSIAAARHESVGAVPALVVNKVVQLMQVHRGLSAGMLGGDEALAARRPAARDALEKAMAEVAASFAAAQVPAAQNSAWTQAQQTWKTLEQAVAARSLQTAQSTAQHTQLIASIMLINEGLLHAYDLQTDPDTDTNALIQASLVHAPMLGEKLGVLRAQGSGFLGRGELPAQDKGQLLMLRQRVTELQAETLRSFDRALERNPQFRQSMGSKTQEIQGLITQSLQLLESEVINATEFKLPAKDYFDHFTRTIEALYALNAQAAGNLTQALDNRVSNLQQSLLWVAVALVATLSLTTGVALVFVRSMTQPLAQAVQLSRAVAQGDLSGGPIAHGTNEVGQLLEALLQMRRQLTDVVRNVRGGSESVATASVQIAQGNIDCRPAPKARPARWRKPQHPWSNSTPPCGKTPTARSRPASWPPAPAPWPCRAARWWRKWWTPCTASTRRRKKSPTSSA